MTDPAFNLPYFDLLLEGRARGDEAAAVFDRFVHWGYWATPPSAAVGREDFLAAMQRLNDEVLAAADLRDGLSVLDAGCGFGGTLASINESRRGVRLTGVNIDRRQIAVARERTRPKSGNELVFVEADACRLPFPDGSFDRVLAVECIFHFPSRARFLKEAARVLRPGGRVALSDFVPANPDSAPGWASRWLERKIAEGYGTVSGWPDGDYAAMAAAAGLTIDLDRDITAETLPTYDFLLDLIRRQAMGGPAGKMLWPTRLLKWVSVLKAVRYRVVGFARRA